MPISTGLKLGCCFVDDLSPVIRLLVHIWVALPIVEAFVQYLRTTVAIFRDIATFRNDIDHVTGQIAHWFEGKVHDNFGALLVEVGSLESLHQAPGGAGDGEAQLHLQFGRVSPPRRVPKELTNDVRMRNACGHERGAIRFNDDTVRAENPHELNCLIEYSVEELFDFMLLRDVDVRSGHSLRSLFGVAVYPTASKNSSVCAAGMSKPVNRFITFGDAVNALLDGGFYSFAIVGMEARLPLSIRIESSRFVPQLRVQFGRCIGRVVGHVPLPSADIAAFNG